MSLDYHKVWNALNELESTTSKICSARQILESAIDALADHKYNKAEFLMYAVDEFLQYYLEDFDRKFKTSWNETVIKLNVENAKSKDWQSFYYPEEVSNSTEYTEEEIDAMCSNLKKESIDDNKTLSYQEAINEGWEMTADGFWQQDIINFPSKNWTVAVEVDAASGEYYLQLPDEVVELVKWKENDDLKWVDNGDGSFSISKVNADE